MATFTTIINMSLHLLLVGLTVVALQYFKVPIPTSYVIGMYFFVQTARLHHGVNSFAIDMLKNPEEVARKIIEVAKEKGDKNGE